MTVACPRRTERRDPRGAQVTPRDLLLLGFLADAGYASSGALGRLAGMSGDMVRRRLRVLRDLGLVKKHVVALNEPDKVTLTTEGRRLVAEKSGREVDDIPPGILGRGSHLHHDMGVDVAVALMVALGLCNIWRLTDYWFERRVRAELGAPGGALVPDAVVHLEDRNGRAHVLAIEIETGTNDPKWVAARKLTVYGEHFAERRPLFGCASWSVCIVTRTLAQLHRVTTALWRAGVPEGLVYLLPLPDLDPETVLEDVWSTPRAVPGNEDVALMPASPFPRVTTDHHDRCDGLAVESSRQPGPVAPARYARSGARSAP
ncbi:MAG: replication-relaxation family protein [Myxococcota bacterium]